MYILINYQQSFLFMPIFIYIFGLSGCNAFVGLILIVFWINKKVHKPWIVEKQCVFFYDRPFVGGYMFVH